MSTLRNKITDGVLFAVCIRDMLIYSHGSVGRIATITVLRKLRTGNKND